MKNGELFHPSGVYAAMVTPFDQKGGVNHQAVRDIIHFMVEKGADGVFPVSNVGEFLTMEQEEKKALIKTVTEAARGRIRVIPGVTDLHTGRALELCEYAADCGADGVVLSAPYYYAHSQAYIAKYLETIVDRSPLPVIFYHSPKFVNAIDFESMISLLKHKNVTAVKESSGDVALIIKLMERIQKDQIDVHVMVGWEELLLAALPYGVCGCVVSCGAIVPEILKKIMECFQQGDYETATRCERAVNRITSALGRYGFPQGYKMGVLARGMRFQICRSPEMVATEEEWQSAIPVLSEMINDELRGLGL